MSTGKARPSLAMTGASPRSCATRAPSSVADIGRMRRSSRKPRWQSSARASPRSASSERSWNSSNSTAPMPESSGSSRIMRVKTPSVTTSMRVFGPDFETIRARNPIRSPTASDKECAMRSAAARAAMRRGSSTRILRPRSQLSFIKASGTRVVLPAPGGATRTADARAARALRTSSRTASIGSGVANFMPAVSSSRVGFTSDACRGSQGKSASRSRPAKSSSRVPIATWPCASRGQSCGSRSQYSSMPLSSGSRR